MKMTLPNEEDFVLKEVLINGIEAVLIYPKAFPKWNEDNKYFRSSLWRKSDLKPLSLGFRKYPNLGETPDFEPINFNKPIQFIVKKDGSALYLSKINNNICVRTRQTVDASLQQNGNEIDLFKEKYPKLFNNDLIDSENFTILTEWTTPTNVICLKETAAPELWLTGIVRHEDYSYSDQNELDDLAAEWGVKRPKRYHFNNFDDAIKFAENATDIEGFVLYCNDGQVLKKTKSILYLKLHRFRSNANLETVIDLFCEFNYPSLEQFKLELIKRFDFECAELVLGFCEQVCNSYKEVEIILKEMREFVGPLKELSRKEAALKIKEKYPERAAFCFKILDNKEISVDDIKKLIGQILKP